MNEISIFLTGLGLTRAAAIAALRYLQPHLKAILTELCGTDDRARSWTTFSNITLLLTPLIFALRIQPQNGTASTLVYEMSNQLSLALLGFVLSLGIVGIVISKFIPLKPPELARMEQTPGRVSVK